MHAPHFSFDFSTLPTGCIGNSSTSNCHRACEFDNNGFGFGSWSGSGSGSSYSASSGYFNAKGNRNAARSGKTRYEVTMRLGANLTGYYRNSEREQLAGVMERQVSVEYSPSPMIYPASTLSTALRRRQRRRNCPADLCPDDYETTRLRDLHVHSVFQVQSPCPQ